VTTIEKHTAEAGRPDAAKPAIPPLRPHVIGAIFRRDFLGYFSNPAGYVFIALFVAIGSIATFCLPEFFARNLANLDQLNTWMPYLLLFFIPAVTMTIWAEERRQGTDELLLTLPARDLEVVLGKFLAALGIYTASLAFLALGHLIVFRLFPGIGRPDLGIFFATYLGYWLMGMMLIAFGMVASALSTNATVAFILGALLCGIPVFANLLGATASGLPKIGPGLGGALRAASVPEQFRDFGSGVVPLGGVSYFVGLTAVMLYLNMVLLGRRHWAGGAQSRGHWLHYLARTVCLVVGLASLYAILAHTGLRADVSAEQLNTLSPIARDLIRQIPENRPVYIQAFYSPDVPREYVETRADLLNLLREVQAIGGNRIRLNLVPTERYSPAAREAEKKFGINPKRVFTTSEGRQSSEEIFLGVGMTSGTEETVIPFLDRGLSVEYELVRSLRVVSGSHRKKVGVLQTDAKLLGGFDFRSMNQNNEWEVVTELKKQYEVSSIAADQPIPTDLDALLVAQPSSLNQKQIDTLTDFVRAGGPTLMFVDPMPFVDPTISPREPKQPPGGMMGGAPPPEPKGDLAPLLDLLGVNWPDDEIVWNRYNPHPMLADAPPEYVFIGAGAFAGHGSAVDAFGKDPASKDLQEVVLLFGGDLKPRGGNLEFTPLLRTNEDGGTLLWQDTVQRGFMGMMNLNRMRAYFPSNLAYTLAARVKGKLPAAKKDEAKDRKDDTRKEEVKGDKPVHVVLIADLDLISDTFFQLRRDRPEQYDFLNFDNVTFVLNCVDTLVGDDSFIALRQRRPKHRTLEAVEAQSRRFINKNQEADKKADDDAKQSLKDAQAQLDKKVKEVKDRGDLDERTKEIMLESLQEVENRRFEVTKATIDSKKQRAQELNRAEREQGVRGIHSGVRVPAILLPLLPVLLLGVSVFFIRANRENRGASPNRLV
jgi:ABC-2 type transport system permease protein